MVECGRWEMGLKGYSRNATYNRTMNEPDFHDPSNLPQESMGSCCPLALDAAMYVRARLLYPTHLADMHQLPYPRRGCPFAHTTSSASPSHRTTAHHTFHKTKFRVIKSGYHICHRKSTSTQHTNPTPFFASSLPWPTPLIFSRLLLRRPRRPRSPPSPQFLGVYRLLRRLHHHLRHRLRPHQH
jgi:hypothetical protein